MLYLLKEFRRMHHQATNRLAKRIAPGITEFSYVLIHLLLYIPGAAINGARRRLGLANSRTPESVREAYDIVRNRIRISDFETYVYGQPEDFYLVLDNRHIRYGSRYEIRKKERTHVVDTIKGVCRDNNSPVIVEFGSGNGANVLLLKREIPNARIIGLELSPSSVSLARAAAEKFGIDVEFYVCDITNSPKSWEDLQIEHLDVHVCFSVHALEQIPGRFREAVNTMLEISRETVVFIEPVSELMRGSMRSLVSRLRLVAVDYLDGLYTYVECHSDVVDARALGFGITPFNESCQIIVKPNGRHVRTPES